MSGATSAPAITLHSWLATCSARRRLAACCGRRAEEAAAASPGCLLRGRHACPPSRRGGVGNRLLGPHDCRRSSWMESWKTTGPDVEPWLGLRTGGPRNAGLSTRIRHSVPRPKGSGPPCGRTRPPIPRSGPSTAVHAANTVMTVMTDVEEWRKIHTPNDAASREPEALRDAALVTYILDRPAHGVDLT